MVRNKTTGEVFFYSKGSPEKMYSYLREEDREEAENRVNDLAKKGLRGNAFWFLLLVDLLYIE